MLASSRKIASVPLPWWTSKSTIAMRSSPRHCCAAVLEGGYDVRTLPGLVRAALEGFDS